MVQPDPLVSVIVPCLDAGATLRESVDSALAQTWSSLEVVVVDDGSTDPLTLRVLEELPAGVRVIHQENRGLPTARNVAIAAARGEFVLPLDADDLIDPPYVEAAVAAMRADPDLGIVYCHADLFGAREGPWDLPPYSLDTMLVENCVFCTALFRRADWERIGGYDESMTKGREDHQFWLRIVGLGRQVKQLDGRWFHYRISPGSLNSHFERDDMVAIYAYIMRTNLDLYVAHAEALFRYRFAQQDALTDLRYRYGRLERLIERHQRTYALLRGARRGLLAGRERFRGGR